MIIVLQNQARQEAQPGCVSNAEDEGQTLLRRRFSLSHALQVLHITYVDSVSFQIPNTLTSCWPSVSHQTCMIMILICRPSLSELNALLEKEGVDLEVEEKRSNHNSNFKFPPKRSPNKTCVCDQSVLLHWPKTFPILTKTISANYFHWSKYFRFRPNIFIDGPFPAFEEDKWPWVRTYQQNNVQILIMALQFCQSCYVCKITHCVLNYTLCVTLHHRKNSYLIFVTGTTGGACVTFFCQV